MARWAAVWCGPHTGGEHLATYVQRRAHGHLGLAAAAARVNRAEIKQATCTHAAVRVPYDVVAWADALPSHWFNTRGAHTIANRQPPMLGFKQTSPRKFTRSMCA